MPVDMPYIATDMKKSPGDMYMHYSHLYNSAKTANMHERQIDVRNNVAYMNDVCPPGLKNALYKENRQEQNYSLAQYIIRGHLGNVMMNWFDPKFIPGEGDPVDATEAAHAVWVSNKDKYNYKASVYSCLESGYIKRGVEVMVIDRPNSNPRSWGIRFVPWRSDLFINDPNVYSDRISRDARQCWLIGYMPACRMAQVFHNADKDIMRRFMNQDKQYTNFNRIKPDVFDDIDTTKFGQSHQFVQYLHIERVKVERRFAHVGNGVTVEVPKSEYKMGSVEDIALVQQWAMANGFQINDDMIFTVTDFMPELWRTSFSPSLGIILEHKKDFIQLGEHLPVYVWAFQMKNGMTLGAMDYMWDTLQDFQKRELAKTKIITKTPVSGKSWFRKDMFDGDEDAIEEMVMDFNDPSKPLAIPEGAPPVPEGFGILQGTQIPPSILQDENFKMMLVEKIGMLPPALQGRSERQADSGIAIGRKVIEGTVMMRPESESIIQHENDKHEDWLKTAIRLYGHPVNAGREFRSADGKISTVINQFVGYDPAGNEVYRNHIGSLKNANVIISQTQDNDYMAQARREMAAAALQTMIPSEQNILTRSVIEYELAVNMDHGSDETKAMAKKAAEKQMYINNLRADMEIAAMESQMQKAGGQPGGGAPVGQEGQPQGGNPEQQIESVRPPVRQSERTAGPQPESARQTTPEMV